MSEISRVGSTTPAAPQDRGAAVPQGGPAFHVGEAPAGPASAAAPPPAAPPAALDGMLAVQEQAGEQLRDREARRHAQSVLAALAALQRSLLAGEGETAADGLAGACAALRAALGGTVLAADPALAALVGAVEIRAKVVLARIEVTNRTVNRPKPESPSVSES